MSFIDTDDDAFSVAARRIANSVRRPNADLQLPVQSQPQPTTYIIEPDLMETQTGNMHLPQDVAFDDVGNPYNTITGKPVKVVRRPNVLPIAKTPEGFTFAMPKMLDIAGNVMSPLAAGRVPVKAGEVVLGSGAVRTFKTPNPTQLENIINKTDYKELRGLIDDSGVHVWDAGKSTHHDMAKELGLNYNIDNRLHITPAKDDPGFYNVDFDDKWLKYENLNSNPKLKQLLNNNNLLVNVPGAGRISGPEFLKLYSDTRPQVAGAVGHAIEKNQPFYSGLEQAVANAKVNKADAAQWLGYLKNQPGVKSEELGYVLNNLPEGQITREGLQDIIKNNKVELKEVVKGDPVKVSFEEALAAHSRGMDIFATDPKNINSAIKVTLDNGELLPYVLNNPNKFDFRIGNLTDFEKGKLGTKYHDYQLPGGPLSRDTEILTKEGWKRIDSVTIGEEIITRKDEDGELEWQPILAIPSVYSEKLYHFYNQSIDMQVTANHKMVVRKRRRSSRGIFRITAQELWTTSECVVPLTGNWKGIGSKTLFGYDACDAAEFIGWYLAEGSYKHKNGIKNTIQIAQSRVHNPDNCDRLEALFDRLGVTWKYYGNGYGIGSKSINKSLLDLLHNQPTSEGKFIPPLFFNENKHVVNSLLAGLILGDGHYKEEGYDDYGSLRQARKIFFSKSKSLADGVQILALLSGYRASVRKRPTGIYVVGINSKEWNSVDDAKYAIVDYHDFAFCVTVENHCIYVRRNGVAAFTGNSDYKEMLLTLPADKVQAYAIRYKDGTQMGSSFSSKAEAEATLKELFPNRKDLEIVPEVPTNDGVRTGTKYNPDTTFKSSHWDEPNILAHVRYNDRDIPEVGKSLHLEEIQSDWHQAGRKQGYKNNLSENEKLELKSLKIKKDNGSMNGDEAVRLGELSNKEAAYGGVPDAPFKKNWDELAFKRMLHKAAVEGYDSVSWTPGEAQAARYDLSKQVDKIDWSKNETGNQIVRIAPKNGASNLNLQLDKDGKVVETFPRSQAAQFEGKHLADVVGKEHAEKILSKSDGSLEGEGLKIGGKGMKSFYDKMLVDKANALAKKYGAKVETKETVSDKAGWHITPPDQTVSGKWIVKSNDYNSKGLQFETKAEAEKALADKQLKLPVHVLKLTPELRAKAKSGFPLFSSTPITTPVDYDPFQTNKKYRLVPIQGNPFNE